MKNAFEPRKLLSASIGAGVPVNHFARHAAPATEHERGEDKMAEIVGEGAGRRRDLVAAGANP